MKPSRFTIELDIDGSKYLYNSLSNAYAKIDEDHYETYLKIKNNDTDYDEKMSIDLYNGGFVINDNEDEIGYMNFFEKVMRYGSSSLGLTIAPTLQCNFRCKYCYEIHENLFMSDDVQKLLIEFVTKNISRYKNISVSWYGGEPLLALSIIRDLSKRLIKIAEENNVIYESGIISNGYLLTKSVAQILKDECKISSVQITLDGIREIHDINRPLENGQGTFDVIFQNLRNIIEILNVSIRINISKDNYQQLFQLLDILNDEGILDKIHIYIAPVSSVENTESKKIQYMCLNKNDFADIEIEFIKYLIEKKVNINHFYPLYKPVVCSSISSNSFVIDPEGYLYKCWNVVCNKSFSIGNLKDGIKFKQKEFLEWANWELPDRCLKCEIMPICQSSCPYNTFYNNECSTIKYNIINLLKLFKDYHQFKDISGRR